MWHSSGDCVCTEHVCVWAGELGACADTAVRLDYVVRMRTQNLRLEVDDDTTSGNVLLVLMGIRFSECVCVCVYSKSNSCKLWVEQLRMTFNRLIQFVTYRCAILSWWNIRNIMKSCWIPSIFRSFTEDMTRMFYTRLRRTCTGRMPLSLWAAARSNRNLMQSFIASPRLRLCRRRRGCLPSSFLSHSMRCLSVPQTMSAAATMATTTRDNER